MGRLDRVNEQIKREISGILQKQLGDPRLEFVTITEVIVSRDLRQAKVYFSVLGNPKQREDSLKCLESARGIIRKQLGQRMMIRYTPELFFIYDQSLEASARIEQALQEIHNESKENKNSHSEA